MSAQMVLQLIGEIEKHVIEYEGGGNSSEAATTILINLSSINDEYGRTYPYVAEQSEMVKRAVIKLCSARQKSRVEELKILILKECAALRRYVSRIKT